MAMGRRPAEANVAVDTAAHAVDVLETQLQERSEPDDHSPPPEAEEGTPAPEDGDHQMPEAPEPGGGGAPGPSLDDTQSRPSPNRTTDDKELHDIEAEAEAVSEDAPVIEPTDGEEIRLDLSYIDHPPKD
jgi:hypothetical protein